MFCHCNGRLALQNVSSISETAGVCMSTSAANDTVSKVLSEADLGSDHVSANVE